MCCSGDDLDLSFTTQMRVCLPVHLNDRVIKTAHNQQRWRFNQRQHICGEIGTPTSRHNRSYDRAELCCRNQCCSSSSARAEITGAHMIKLSPQPVSCVYQPVGEQIDVEAKMSGVSIDSFLIARK